MLEQIETNIEFSQWKSEEKKNKRRSTIMGEWEMGKIT